MVFLLKILKNKWTWLILGGLILIGYITYLNNSISKLNHDLEISKTNSQAYENLYNGELAANNVLRLTEYELKHSNDSLLKELGKYIEENKKLKRPIIVQGVTETIVDTLIVEVPIKLPEFNITKVFNPETKITVIGRDSILDIIPNISNTLKVEIGISKEFRNQYKNRWVRFWHFDYKKIDVYKYKLDNSNDLIKINDCKIIKVENK